MTGDWTRSGPATFLIALMIAACGGPSGSAVTASPSAMATASPTPSPVVAPSASAATPLPSPTTTSWYPWLPPIDTSVDAVFEVDTFVTARADVVPVSGTPGGPPYRFDTGLPDPSSNPVMGFPRDTLIVVVHGPVVVDDIQWYLLAPAQLAIDIPMGWAPAWRPDGSPYVDRTPFSCPVSPVTTAELAKLLLIDGLPACYRDTEVTIVGAMVCSGEPDTTVTGATWLKGGSCGFEAPPSVYGLDPDLAPGRYAVTGHFLDEEARLCRSIDAGDAAQGMLDAVMHCRRAFVATSAEPL